MMMEHDIRRCRGCGCTDNDCPNCIDSMGQPCRWVKDDLCSRCANSAGHTVASDPSDPFLSNPANHPNGVVHGQPQYPDCCDETLMFGMRDNYHEFSLGITTVLECLHFAERAGEVPTLDDDWWIKLCNRYPSLQRLTTDRDASD